MIKNRGFFYGWWIVAAGFFLTFAGIGILINTYGVFFRGIIQDTGFSRAGLGLYFTLFSLAVVISSPITGRLFVKFNTQVVLSVCLTAAGLTFISFSLADKLWHFYLLGIILGIFGAGTSTLPASILITNWFKEKRGTAIGIAFTGSGIGGMISNPLAQYLIGNFGWRTAYVVLGILFLAVTLPFSLFVIRLHPSEKGLLPFGESTETVDGESNASGRGLSTSEAAKSPLFWLLGAAMFMSCLIIVGVQNNVPIFLQDMGHTATFASTIMAVYMGVLVLGKMLLGQILDRFGAKAGIAFSIVMFTAASAALINGRSPVFAVVFALMLAMATPVSTVYPSYVTGHLFGSLDYGPIYGIQAVFLSLGMAFAMPITGTAFEKTGSLVPVWYFFIIIALILLVLLLFILGRQPGLEKRWHSRDYHV